MRLILRIAILWFLVPGYIISASAQTDRFGVLVEDFDARPMSVAEKRTLQSALALEGEYVGMLDGRWGRLSQEALESYTRKNFSREPMNVDAAFLVSQYIDSLKTFGWSMRTERMVGLSFALPEIGLGPEDRSSGFVIWKHQRIGLTILAARHVTSDMRYVHSLLIDNLKLVEEPYRIRRTHRWVTSSRSQDGESRYARSDFINGAWSSIVLKAGSQGQNVLSLIAGSITAGTPQSMTAPTGGRIEELYNLTAAYLAEYDNSPDIANNRPGSAETLPKRRSGSGSGFFVNQKGFVLTNAHVVDGCGEILVNGKLANVVASSKDYDLAILRSTSVVNPDSIASFSALPARLNSDVTVVGFPLHGTLGGMNVTRGSVSALSGLGGNLATMQISAPITAGNSGGPVINKYGQVVGVVVSQLREVAGAEESGVVPQNINFSIRGEIAKSFLASQGIQFSVHAGKTVQEPTAIAEAARGYTALVTCR